MRTTWQQRGKIMPSYRQPRLTVKCQKWLSTRRNHQSSFWVTRKKKNTSRCPTGQDAALKGNWNLSTHEDCQAADHSKQAIVLRFQGQTKKSFNYGRWSHSVVTSSLRSHIQCSPPGFSVHGILQAWVLEWVAISFSRLSSWPRDGTRVCRIVGRCFTLRTTREAL